jgi:hypothetical protein
MLKRIMIALAITIAALAFIDRVSLLVAPCGPGGGAYSDQKSPNDDNCATREGIVIAGIEWLREQTPEFWTVLATIAVAVFTWTLWLSTDKMWRVTDATLKHSERTAIRELRAYVSVKEILMQQFRGLDTMGAHGVIAGPVQNHRISVILENGGKAPTRKAIVNVNYELRDNDLPNDFDFPDGRLIEPAAIGAGGTFGTPAFFISNSGAAEIVAKRKRLFIWGWIDYDDVFEGTPRHRTEFCFDVSPDEVPDKGNTYLRFPTHGRFNGIDGDCVRQPRPYKEPNS